ncbi:hypothetical protein Pla110_13070 [Polystyrenella longa]|uniref:Uncharacterized protein n=1 Tax=Polystyrenella longa TaxID=2528007 RepID=A0A518CK37_9PLAN|nr:hypothetical protein Pla110_13070 [Polystyrenella longa]
MKLNEFPIAMLLIADRWQFLKTMRSNAANISAGCSSITTATLRETASNKCRSSCCDSALPFRSEGYFRIESDNQLRAVKRISSENHLLSATQPLGITRFLHRLNIFTIRWRRGRIKCKSRTKVRLLFHHHPSHRSPDKIRHRPPEVLLHHCKCPHSRDIDHH